jgi:alcohol dehydrogenase class IV
MTQYSLAAMPKIVGGAGARHKLAAIAGDLVEAGASLLLVADPGLPTGLTEEVERGLRTGGFAVARFSDFGGDPSAAATDAAARLARESGARAVVSLGGGSALDLGKAAAAIAGGSEPAVHYELAQAPFPSGRLASIVIPTTSGTGSELTRTSVLTRDDKAKTWLWGDAIKPDRVILDPETTLTLPAGLTASTGIDALVHAVEAATNANAHPANNLYAHEAIRLVTDNLEAAVGDGRNLAAREAMQRAAALAGIAIDNCGTAIAHTVGHALASLRPIHHGRAVALGLMASLRWNMEGDDGRFEAAARAMGAASAAALPQAFEALVRASGLTVSLAEEFAGVTPALLAAQMARPENAAMRRSNRRASTDSDLLTIAETVLSQS